MLNHQASNTNYHFTVDFSAINAIKYEYIVLYSRQDGCMIGPIRCRKKTRWLQGRSVEKQNKMAAVQVR